MSDIEELRSRVDAVEARMAHVMLDTATTRFMAAQADRDVAEIWLAQRGQTRVLNALRETQVEQGRALGGHGRRLVVLRESQVEQGQMLTAIMERLGIAPPDCGEEPPPAES